MAGKKPTWGKHPFPAPLELETVICKYNITEYRTTIRPGIYPVASRRMDNSRFDFDSSVIVEAARAELVHLRELKDELPDCPVSIFGHADPSGADEYNKMLSGRRALTVFGLLVRDVEPREKLYQDNSTGGKWGNCSLQLIREEQGSYIDGRGCLPCL